MEIHLRVWRQAAAAAAGQFVQYTVPQANPDMSFLELLDVLNQQLIQAGRGNLCNTPCPRPIQTCPF